LIRKFDRNGNFNEMSSVRNWIGKGNFYTGMGGHGNKKPILAQLKIHHATLAADMFNRILCSAFRGLSVGVNSVLAES